jgi:hypothetical protein
MKRDYASVSELRWICLGGESDGWGLVVAVIGNVLEQSSSWVSDVGKVCNRP